MSKHHTIVATSAEAGLRLDVLLSARLEELSRSRIQRLIIGEMVTKNGVCMKPCRIMREGEEVRLTIPDPEPAVPVAEEIPLRIIFEDGDLIVIDKPAGLVVHPGAGNRRGTLVNALLGREGLLSEIGGVTRPGIVHRLDKDTSGLMVVAKNDMAHLALSSALARREVARVYWALALRPFKTLSGVIDAPVGRHPTVRTKMCADGRGGRDALTKWRLLEQLDGCALVECRLATGRTHQIRVHLAHERHPVLGDQLYGGGAELAEKLVPRKAMILKQAIRAVTRQMLHARELVFKHPRTGGEQHFIADPPNDFMTVLEAFREQARASWKGSS
ncbi:MAG: RluA family pseudouridine synthase [Candidatus Sumerlaeota bacterium]|nr:RluA family pseudouridine synthase [Candidatus Sumerlaeota bacterium]